MLAYYDGLQSVVPVRILGRTEDNELVMKVTADRYPFKRGETMIRSNLHVHRREAIKFRKFGSYILPSRDKPIDPASFDIVSD